jgi:hypothetical protein
LGVKIASLSIRQPNKWVKIAITAKPDADEPPKAQKKTAFTPSQVMLST